MKIAYLGYDFFASCLQNLLDAGHTVPKIFSCQVDNKYNFNTQIRAIAEKAGSNFSLNVVTEEDLQNLKDEKYDLIVSAAYPYRIPILPDMPKAINIHPTLLPEGKGPWPLPWIILKKLQKSGVTIHKISEEFDSGDIIIQESFDVQSRDDLETISARSQMVASKLIRMLIENFDFYWDNAMPQSSLGTYWPDPDDATRTIHWSADVEEIDRVVRAFGKFDSFAEFDQKEWIVQDISYWKENHLYTPGSVTHRMNKEVVIAAKDGFVCLRFYNIDPDFKNI